MSNYLITNCSDQVSYIVNPNANAMASGTTNYFTFTGSTPSGCYYIANATGDQTVDFVLTISSNYSDCPSCILDNELPRSAGTESTVCVICYDTISGETITVVSPPHPVWTDSRGIEVTQLNAIALGGMNGLNS